jgi:hypothetical protein
VIGLWLTCDPVDHGAGDLRREQRLAGGDGLDGRDELLGRGPLEQEPGGAGAQRPEDIIIVVERGQDQHARLRDSTDDLPGGGDAV